VTTTPLPATSGVTSRRHAPDDTVGIAVVLRPRAVVGGALAIALLLAAAHFGALALTQLAPGGSVPEPLKLNAEATVATWFSTALHLVNAALLAVIAARAPHRERWRWTLLAVAVLAVSADEIAGVHEHVSWILHTQLRTTGVLTYAWVVPATAAVVALAVLCGRLVLSRPGGLVVALGAAVFFGGAVAVELVEGWWVGGGGTTTDGVFLLLNGVEETMEMVGTVIAMRGLLRMAAGSGIAVPTGRAQAGATS
jgi:hypothetical protein